MSSKLLLSLLALTASTTVHARTHIGGCTSVHTTNQWGHASMLWYVPETGEICDIPDCGGGRAPPKRDNPACPGYTGTATYEPSFIDLPTPTPTPTPEPEPEPETDSSVSAPASTSISISDIQTSETVLETSESRTGGITSPPVPSVTAMTMSQSRIPTGTGIVSVPGDNTTVTTGPPVPVQTDGAPAMAVAGGLMAGLVAVAGLLVM